MLVVDMASRQSSRRRTPSARATSLTAPTRQARSVKRVSTDSRPQHPKRQRDNSNRRLPTVAPRHDSPTPQASTNESILAAITDLSKNMVSMAAMLQKTTESVNSLTNAAKDSDPINSNEPDSVPDSHRDYDRGCRADPVLAGRNAAHEAVANNLESHTATIMGMDNGAPCNEQNDFVSVGLPIDVFVSDKLKNKIWANEFIDMSSLIDQGQEDEVFQLSMTTGEGGTVSFTPKRKANKMMNMGKWLSAFQVYMAIYC